MTSFLWNMTSKNLYEKLREVFILPTSRRLQQLSCGLNVQSNKLDTKYLEKRVQSLEKREKICCLIIDKVYTSSRIEYMNGKFFGLTQSGDPANTVLAFMLQSLGRKFKDVIYLEPVSKLNVFVITSITSC